MSKSAKPYIDFAAVRAAVTIEKILGHYNLLDSLKPAGTDSLRGPCPIHDGSNPKQFSVNLAKNCWYCHSDCKEGGNALDFVARMEDCEVHEAALLVDEWFRLGLAGRREKEASGNSRRTKPNRSRESSPADSEPEAPAKEENPLPDHASSTDTPAQAKRGEFTENVPLTFQLQNLESDHPYFEERGLTPETVERLGLGFCKRGTMAGRVVVPVHNAAGDLVAYVGRFPGEPLEERPKYKFPKGFHKSLEVFNLHRVLDEEAAGPLILVEGVFDAMHLTQLGVRRVAALMGSSLSDAQAHLLADCLHPTDSVAILFDEDEAGRKGREDAAAKLAPFLSVRIVSPGEEGTQPEDLSMEDIQNLHLA